MCTGEKLPISNRLCVLVSILMPACAIMPFGCASQSSSPASEVGAAVEQPAKLGKRPHIPKVPADKVSKPEADVPALSREELSKAAMDLSEGLKEYRTKRSPLASETTSPPTSMPTDGPQIQANQPEVPKAEPVQPAVAPPSTAPALPNPEPAPGNVSAPKSKESVQTVEPWIQPVADVSAASIEPIVVKPAIPAPPEPPVFSMSAVRLCQSVQGFGKYVVLPSYTLMAGRSSAMILYTQVQGYTSKIEVDKVGVEQNVVLLGQSVTLFLDADGSEQLKIPESVIRDQSLSKRQDFFLVQRLDLPPTLSVGRYALKVRLRDLQSGAEADERVTIQVVADPSVLAK